MTYLLPIAAKAITRQTTSTVAVPLAPSSLRILAAERAPFGRRLRRRLMRPSVLE